MGVSFTPEQKAKACEEILALVRGGMSASAACRSNDWMPAETTFRGWCDDDQELAAQYASARDIRSDLIFEQCLAIADSQEGDMVPSPDGGDQINHDVINRARLRIDTRRWMLGKMQPKKYGDKIDLNRSGGIAITGIEVTFVEPSDKS